MAAANPRAVGIPPSCSFKIAMNCPSLNLLRFISSVALRQTLPKAITFQESRSPSAHSNTAAHPVDHKTNHRGAEVTVVAGVQLWHAGVRGARCVADRASSYPN